MDNLDKNGKSPTHSKSPHRDRVDRPSLKRERPSPYHRGGKGGFGPRPSGSNKPPPYNRVFVNNIAYEEKWQSLKDSFRNKVGEVTYVELFTDDHGKSRGYGVVEFKNRELCEKAVKIMNRFEINNRKLVVKEDYNGELLRKMLLRDGHPAALQLGAPPMPGLPPPMPGRGPLPPIAPPLAGMGLGRGNVAPPLFPNNSNDTMGLNRLSDRSQPTGPIGKTVFVANLDYKVTYSKLKEVFQLAGRVVKVDLMLDKDNKSRGMATVTFEDPLEAAQAISMLNNQKLYDRTMIVKMDKDNNRGQNRAAELPSGLGGIGPSLQSFRPQRELGGIAGLGDGLGNNSLGMLSSNALGLGGSRGLSDMNKSNSTNPLAAGLTALTQQASRLSETLQSNPGGLGLSGLGGLSDLARLGLVAGGRDSIDQRLLEERARLISTVRSPFSDRERIEMDIARVDNRIRDIDRSMAETERGRNVGQPSLPPMPPPMQRDRVPGSTVFVRNLPYSLTWQTLRDKFSRCGRVMFATIKTENGKSRGFGNVRFETAEQAQAAVRHFHGMDMEGRKIDVHIDNRA
ncbi:myelin expression factor 2-like [Clavelina lepadiformis]|uniref:myelin expression factor 2-like n=1 Tax=Clavelina lepadiformis TaxID=159417 RepID=UPI004043821C